MMRKSGCIGLGDILEAFACLQPNNQKSKEQIADMLGFAWLEQQLPSPRDERPRTYEPTSIREEKFSPVVQPSWQLHDKPALRPAHPTVREVNQRRDSAKVLLQATSETGESIDPGILPNGTAWQPSPPDPLFPPRQQRHLLVALVRVLGALGGIDEAVLADTMARQGYISHLPRLQRWYFPKGIQLLLDVGDDMTPLIQDILPLLELLKPILAGRGRVLRFTGCPTQGVTHDGDCFSPYQPPPPGVPVLLISRMGVQWELNGMPAELARQWTGLAERLHHIRVPLVILLPGRAKHLPSFLRRHATIVQWDRKTRLGDVLRSRRSKG